MGNHSTRGIPLQSWMTCSLASLHSKEFHIVWPTTNELILVGVSSPYRNVPLVRSQNPDTQVFEWIHYNNSAAIWILALSLAGLSGKLFIHKPILSRVLCKPFMMLGCMALVAFGRTYRREMDGRHNMWNCCKISADWCLLTPLRRNVLPCWILKDLITPNSSA
jgi:hypothetical protein